jgi:CDGSH-type Zn-finger protein
LEFTADSSAKKFLCQCKHTKNPPFCDGAHSKL